MKPHIIYLRFYVRPMFSDIVKSCYEKHNLKSGTGVEISHKDFRNVVAVEGLQKLHDCEHGEIWGYAPIQLRDGRFDSRGQIFTN